MGDRQPLPDPIRRIQEQLAPYIRTRQETSQIRRVLALQLDSHLEDLSNSAPTARLLSLPSSSLDVKPPQNGIRGLRREYLKCLRANIRARHEYLHYSQELVSDAPPDPSAVSSQRNKDNSPDPASQPSTPSLDTYITLVRQRQKLERLRVLQNYLESLAQKPAVSADFSDPRHVTRNIPPLPQVPVEFLNQLEASGHDQPPINIDERFESLEKAVLQAKLRLKHEQKVLARIRAEKEKAQNGTTGGPNDRLEALGQTRDALIAWIEEELSHAGEDPPEDEFRGNAADPDLGTSISEQLAILQDYYKAYTKTRESLVAIINSAKAKGPTLPLEHLESATEEETGPSNDTSSVSIISSCFNSLLAISDEQKALMQQRSHITAALAKHQKQSASALDRLAEESHLLPSYPMPNRSTSNKDHQSKGLFGADALSKEPASSVKDKAEAWVFAADSANIATKEAVLESVEAGNVALEEARNVLLEQCKLLGIEARVDESGLGIELKSPARDQNRPRRGSSAVLLDEQESGSRAARTDVWASLNGQMGVI